MGYPWTDGQFLTAPDLNAEFASALAAVTAEALAREQGDAAISTVANNALAAVTAEALAREQGDAAIGAVANNALALAGQNLPRAGGVMLGVLTLASDPVQPLDAATKRYADGMLPLVGGMLTGMLTLAGDPTTALHAATKQYVDQRAITIAALTTVILSLPITLPATSGQLWVNGGVLSIS